MRLACFLITYFFIKTELQRHPELVGQPVIIYGGSRPVVVDHSPQVKGVSAGMALEGALSRCNGVTLLEADLPHYEATFDQVIKALQQCVGKVEKAEPGCAYVGWPGLAYRDEATEVMDSLLAVVDPGFNPRIGVAPGKFPAYVAAAFSPGHQATVVPDDVAGFLRKRSVDLLPLPVDIKTRLHKFGLHTLGQLVDIGVEPLQAEFGVAGRKAGELASGIDTRPLLPEPYQEEITETLTFPSPAIDTEAISMVAEALLERVFARREVKGRYVRSIVAQGQIYRRPPWVKRFVFKEPLRDSARALLVIRNSLETPTFPGPLEDLSLTVEGLTGDSGRQGSLFPEVRQQDQMIEVMRRLELSHGKSSLVTHVRPWEPESRIPERRHVNDQFQPLNTPVPVKVRENQNGRPAAVLADQQWRQVLSIEDLWVLDNEEWWRETPCRRTYYEVMIENSGNITIYRDLADGWWYRQRA